MNDAPAIHIHDLRKTYLVTEREGGVRVENMPLIFSSMYEASRWSVGFYPRWLRFTLTFLIPVAFATTIPAQALAGRLGGGTLAGACLMAAALAVLSRAFWRVGIRRYSSASS